MWWSSRQPTPPPSAPGPIVADIGVRTFAQVNSTLSQLTGVPTSTPAVNATYLAVQQQLPADATLEGFSSSNQIGVAQLAIQYCNAVVNTPSLAAQLFPGVNSEQHRVVLVASRHRFRHQRAGNQSAGHRPRQSTGGHDHHGPTGELDS